jgi:hypothetical protein
MAFPILGVLGAIVPIIERLWPDPNVAQEMKLKMLTLHQEGAFKEIEAQLQNDLAQLAVNKEEAAAGTFRGGWRPMIGWVCAGSFAWNYIGMPIGSWAATVVFGYAGALPPMIDFSVMMPVMLGMLGLGYMRTEEKKVGIK